MTRWLLVTLAFVLTLFITPKLHALYMSSRSLTDLVESEGGARRVVRIAGGESIEVVVHRNETWSHCPGLGIAAQSRSAEPLPHGHARARYRQAGPHESAQAVRLLPLAPARRRAMGPIYYIG
ncbi:MAG: hypothetical protein ACSLFE_02635 [Gemmatimonadaceae bacterium]